MNREIKLKEKYAMGIINQKPIFKADLSNLTQEEIRILKNDMELAEEKQKIYIKVCGQAGVGKSIIISLISKFLMNCGFNVDITTEQDDGVEQRAFKALESGLIHRVDVEIAEVCLGKKPKVQLGKIISDNPVFYENNEWYFWDETWIEKYGPYDTEAEANSACVQYAETL